MKLLEIERVRAQGLEQVPNANPWLATIIESSSDAILYLSTQGTILTWNRAAAALFGRSAAEIVGQDLGVLFAPESASDAARLIARVRAGESLRGLETLQCSKDRASIEVALDVYPVHNESGEVGAMVVIARGRDAGRTAELSLRYSEQRLALALQAGRMAIWEWEIQTGRVHWSPELFEVTGIAPGNADEVRDDFFRRLHPEDGDCVLAISKEVCWTECPLDIEFRFVRGDGEVRWFHYIGQLQRDEAGAPSRMVGTLQDVTERRCLVEALRESEERFRRAVMAAPFPVLIHAEDGEVLTINDAWIESTGYSREELPTTQAWTDRAFGALSGVIQELIRERFTEAHHTAQEGDYSIRTADGRTRIWEFSSAPMGHTVDGRRVLISVATDVTERREAERALHESRERLQAALSASDTGTYRWEFGKDIVEWDENVYRLWGLPPSKAPQRIETFFAMVHPDDRPAVRERCDRCAREGADFIMEMRVIWPDGSLHWLDDHGRTFKDESGRPLYVTGACIDITHRKTSALELQRAKEEAERASRAKDDFLATLSHELRTPLTAMLGWARMINMPGLRPGLVEEGLKSIERNARAQAQLVEDLLDISRIISGKLEVHRSPMNLGTVVEAAAATARPAAEAKKVALTLGLAPQAGFIDGDADRLQQVVANLISNAVKFTPTGGAVHVALFADDGAAVLQVTDTGAGIAPDFLPLVFDRFQQADVSTTRRYGGLGLGLAIVRHVVELHEGTVQADSPGVGQGATFTMRLPRRAATVEPVVEPAGGGAARLTPAQASAGVLQGVHVLVVDDEYDARTLVATVLERAGARVTSVDSVASALRVLEGSHAGAPDVLVSDIAMPGEDGYSLIRQLHDAERRGKPRPPAVALTAHARAEDRIRAHASGFQSYVPKPVEPLELVALVANLAGRQSSQ